MQDKLTKTFLKAKHEPDSNLAHNVWQAIIARDKRIIRFKLWVVSIVGFASLAGLVPALQILLDNLAHSGFYEYFSLIFSDGGSIISYWKELALSITESLPTTSILFTFSLLFVCFLSLKYFIKQIERGQSASLLLSA